MYTVLSGGGGIHIVTSQSFGTLTNDNLVTSLVFILSIYITLLYKRKWNPARFELSLEKMKNKISEYAPGFTYLFISVDNRGVFRGVARGAAVPPQISRGKCPHPDFQVGNKKKRKKGGKRKKRKK